MDKHTQGLLSRFAITRTDGSSAPGGKHEHCEYFVLDLHHDPYAYEALRRYAQVCRREYPKLSDDLVTKLIEIQHREWEAGDKTTPEPLPIVDVQHARRRTDKKT